MLQGCERWLLAKEQGEVSVVARGCWAGLVAAAALFLWWRLWLAVVLVLPRLLAFRSCWSLFFGVVWLRRLLSASAWLCSLLPFCLLAWEVSLRGALHERGLVFACRVLCGAALIRLFALLLWWLWCLWARLSLLRGLLVCF